tara:strand:+ start:1521 stop:2045 length:525 start_codon:yes stop_codon:yes gene_type:complete
MKININIPIEGKDFDNIIEVHNKIKKYHTLSFSLSKTKNRPHITILYGNINKRDIKLAANIINKTTSKITPFKINLSEISRPSRNSKFIFIKVSKNFIISKLKIELHKKLRKIMRVSKNGSEKTKPHITIGHTSLIDRLEKTSLKSNKITAKSIEISRSGNYGTCESRIFKYKL